MNIDSFLALTNQPMVIGISLGTLALLYVGFKVTKFATKIFLLLITLALLAGVGWFFLAGPAN